MPDAFEELVGSLLWEGYALYPYTRGSAKNATPTPFGIVYPQVYANSTSGASASLVLRGVALSEDGMEQAGMGIGIGDYDSVRNLREKSGTLHCQVFSALLRAYITNEPDYYAVVVLDPGSGGYFERNLAPGAVQARKC